MKSDYIHNTQRKMATKPFQIYKNTDPYKIKNKLIPSALLVYALQRYLSIPN